MNMSVAPVAGAPTYAAYEGGAPEDIAVDAAGVGGVHIGTGSDIITAGSAMGAGWADGVTRCMGLS